MKHVSFVWLGVGVNANGPSDVAFRKHAAKAGIRRGASGGALNKMFNTRPQGAADDAASASMDHGTITGIALQAEA
jgi:hypothetical protein